MNVIFTCGGTAGHVNPALALAGYMQERHPDLRVLFVGTPRGMERGLIEKAGYDFRSIEVSSFQRSLSPVPHNFKQIPGSQRFGLRHKLCQRTGFYSIRVVCLQNDTLRTIDSSIYIIQCIEIRTPHRINRTVI